MAAKIKCLAESNKTRTGTTATTRRLHTAPPVRSVDRGRVSSLPRWRGPNYLGTQVRASPSYGVDVVALALAVVLAVALAVLLSHIVPQLVDLMTTPSPLSGTR